VLLAPDTTILHLPTFTAVLLSSSDDLLGRLAKLRRLALLLLFTGVCRARAMLPTAGEFGIDCGALMACCSWLAGSLPICELKVEPVRWL